MNTDNPTTVPANVSDNPEIYIAADGKFAGVPMANVPPRDEWHTTPEGCRIIDRIVKAYYGEAFDSLSVHHINIVDTGNKNCLRQWPSVESLIFDHDILKALFPDDWDLAVMELALTEPLERLRKYEQLMDNLRRPNAIHKPSGEVQST